MSTDGVGGVGSSAGQTVTDVENNFANQGQSGDLIKAASSNHQSALDALVIALNNKDTKPGDIEILRDKVDGARRIMIAISELSRAGHEMLMALIRKLSLN